MPSGGGPTLPQGVTGRAVGETFEQQKRTAPTWRRYARTPRIRKILRSRPGRAADTARRYVITAVARFRHPEVVRAVDTFCVFIGHVKSGGTLLGAILDAHPDALFADEADVLRYVNAGFSREQIFHLLAKGSRHAAMMGRVTARRLEAYHFEIPGQWQGRSRTLRVIGDTRAGPTTRQLGVEPRLIDRLERTLDDVGLRFIHVVRDPFDPIAVTVVRGNRSFDDAVADHAAQCERLVRLRSLIPAEHLLTVRYEDLVGRPNEEIRRACAFLRLAPEPGYVEACAAIIRVDVRPERDRIEWTPGRVAAVRAVIDAVPFLEPYRGGA